MTDFDWTMHLHVSIGCTRRLKIHQPTASPSVTNVAVMSKDKPFASNFLIKQIRPMLSTSGKQKKLKPQLAGQLAGQFQERDELISQLKEQLQAKDDHIAYLSSELDKYQSVFSQKPATRNKDWHKLDLGDGEKGPRKRAIGISAEAHKSVESDHPKHYPKSSTYVIATISNVYLPLNKYFLLTDISICLNKPFVLQKIFVISMFFYCRCDVDVFH